MNYPMKKITFLKSGLWTSVLFSVFLFSCKKKAEPVADNVFYTCSMDPQVMEKQPGNCPICHMELTKIEIDQDDLNSIALSETQIELANIQIDTVRLSSIGEENILSGTIVINENKTEVISTRVDGRIEYLHFKTVGEYVKAGDVLYEIYSDMLNAAQQEYLIALAQKDLLGNETSFNLADASKNKLLLWGLTELQINDLGMKKEIPLTVKIYSKLSGYISEINVTEGQYLMEGETVFRIADLSSLWVEAQLYASETNLTKDNTQVEVRVEGFEETIIGKIAFANPELNPQSKISLIRIEIQNTLMNYKPGMLAYVKVKNKEHEAITLPADAVIQDAKGATIWIQNSNGRFEPRMVTIGMQNSLFIEIISGLEEGELVVTSGVYLLNSEFIFKRGTSAHTGHEGMEM